MEVTDIPVRSCLLELPGPPSHMDSFILKEYMRKVEMKELMANNAII